MFLMEHLICLILTVCYHASEISIENIIMQNLKD